MQQQQSPNSGSAPGDKRGIEELEMFLDYELRAANRYRRFATLVLVGALVGGIDLREEMKDSIRSSDEFFELSSTAAILMGETDTAGALAAVERFRTSCKKGPEMRFSVASFPADARGMAELLWTAHRRLDTASSGEGDTAVNAG